MRVALPILALLLPASAAQAQEAEDPLMAAYRDKTRVVRPCDRSGNAIVVCGSRAERNAKQRLPLPREPEEGVPVRGEPPRASAAQVRQGACGVVGGQGAGCTGGLPVFQAIGALAKAAVAVVDPDADLEPPPPLPDRFKGATPR
ncbi:hypothetical protein [Sphingobium olei]|uniref:Uncharacterized protein n=1 Tax=Sphingobium olei TaxID=420955 RepID=A0ABW3P5P9_9SPHN|nr:hypothetical protein [Sphingobium sp.]